MRRLIAIILTMIYQVGISTGSSANQIVFTDLGTPTAIIYQNPKTKSRTPWDMVYFNDKLYIGGGDYSSNTGPVPVWAYDPISGEWTNTGLLNDEAIGKFVVIDDQLYAPGFDSKGSWEYGNFYRLDNGQWQANVNLPDALHNFDICQYENRLFFGIGTNNSTFSPVKVSNDHGQTFSDVDFIKNDVSIISADYCDYFRVYDFFITEEGLFCMLLAITGKSAQYYEFYRYQNDAFHYVSNSNESGIKIRSFKQEPIGSKITYDGYTYIAAQYLTRTKDFQNTEQIILPHNEMALDLLEDQNFLYVLTAEKEENHYNIRIYVYIYNSFFHPVVEFEAFNIPTSFAKNTNTFYVGYGDIGFDASISGKIQSITIPELTLRLIQDCK